MNFESYLKLTKMNAELFAQIQNPNCDSRRGKESWIINLERWKAYEISYMMPNWRYFRMWRLSGKFKQPAPSPSICFQVLAIQNGEIVFDEILETVNQGGPGERVRFDRNISPRLRSKLGTCAEENCRVRLHYQKRTWKGNGF